MTVTVEKGGGPGAQRGDSTAREVFYDSHFAGGKTKTKSQSPYFGHELIL